MKLGSLHKGYLGISKSRPKAEMKKVWNVDEHVGKSKRNWYDGSPKKSKPYSWSKTGTFHGQSEGWKEHQL